MLPSARLGCSGLVSLCVPNVASSSGPSTVSIRPGAQPRTLASLLTHRTCCRSPFPPRWPRVQRKTAKDVTFSERFYAGHVSTPLSQPA